MVGLLGILILLVVMIVLQMPVGFSMALVGFCGLWYVTGLNSALSMIGTETWSSFSSYGLTVIPLFIFMGTICFHSGVNKNLYQAAYLWFGRTRGGIAMATILACAGFAAICGSNNATAATMTTVALPEMRKYNYNKALSAGSIACGSTLGVVIPPSVVLIVYGIQTGQSIGKLFWGSTLPGILMALLFALTVYLLCVKHKDWGPGGPRVSLIDKLKALPGTIEMFVLFGLVMGGLYTGAYTPTEAGAAGAFFALVIAGAFRKKLSWKGLASAIADSLRVTCMVIVIVWGAVIFGRFLTISRLPFVAVDFVSTLVVPPFMIMICILMIYAIAGMVMDALGFLLISVPIFYPMAIKLGFDPVWFGCILTVVTTMGAITPPVGICAYVVCGMAEDIPLSTVFKGVFWFIPAYCVAMAAMIIFPKIVLFLPGLVR
ncbi:MAG: C4-dicarboxylate ABC transporter permease [Deltaproteobacteria bacterium RBG_13_47_9]|nr:MAG: C4-dicarboxylate ABC transporter permease [Deltaproteobacteria bacterium RBG_13_47_9]